MNRIQRLVAVASAAVAASVVHTTIAGVTIYTSLDAWQAASGPTSVATFSEFPQFTHITDQYAETLGITVSSQSNGQFVSFNSTAYPTDGIGLSGTSGWMDITFTAPASAYFVQASSTFRLDLYQGSVLVGTAGFFIQGSNGLTYAGFTSDDWFDRVRLVSLSAGSGFGVDNIHFSTVPGPSALACMAIAASLGRRRCRAQSV
jgi:hypothetical protein